MAWIQHLLRNWAWGIAVGLLGLCTTAYFSLAQYQAQQLQEQQRLEQAVGEFSQSLTRRLQAYTEIAFGLRSLFMANPAVGRKAFEAAVVQLDVELRYPGIKNIAFTRYVLAAQKPGFERAVRADTSLVAGGYPNFAIHPPGERAEYFVADYLWPQSGSQGVHGLDISAQPANLASMRYAMATGLPTASAPFDLIQEVSDKTGFVVRVPVFAAAPARTFLGSVAVTLRVHELFGALQSEGVLRGLHLDVMDVGSGIPNAQNSKPRPLYVSSATAQAGSAPFVQVLDVYGRKWQLQGRPEGSYLSATERQLPWVMAITGSAISLLLAAVTGLLGKGRRRALDAMAEANSLLYSVIDHAPIRVFWKDRNSRYMGCNTLFAQDAGHDSPQDIKGRMDDELGWSKLAGRYQMEDKAVMESGQARLRFVESQPMPDGSTIWLQKSKVPLRNDAGEVIGILGIHDDITERIRKNEELLQYRGSLEQMVALRTQELQAANRHLHDTQFAMDSVGIGIHWIDVTTGTLLDANRHAAEFLGYSVARMRGMPLRTIIPTLAAHDFALLVDRSRHEGFAHAESELLRSDGTLVPVEWMAYAQHASDGRSERLIAFVTDITARKQTEQELLRAKSAAEAANKAKSAFLANMSHEIRTPLNAITGMTHLVRRAGVTQEQSERLGKIELAGAHLLDILNSILDLSKIEAGKFELEEVPLDVELMVANVVAILGPQARAKHLDILIDNQLPGNHFLGDATRLQQSLLNYGTNAVKFSDKGRITIRLRLLESGAEHALLHFEVEDQGIGIDGSALGRLFSAFEQADSSTTRAHGGTGLGLAITRKLAQLMGGDAGASSTLGQGSRFWFTARLRKSRDQAQPALPEPNLAAEAMLRRDYADRQLLVVEDDPFNQELARLLLGDVCPDLELARDGLQALDMVCNKRYDLILMDMQMPRLDGLDATQRIRALPHGADVPIIAMTANAFVEDRRRCMAAGMNDFLSKPVKPAELYEVLLKWLRR